MSEIELVRLRNALSAFGELVSSERLEEYLELDLQLHLAVYKAAANTVLSDVLLNLIDKVRWIRRASVGYPSRIRDALSEIHRVLDALEARDEKSASAAMRTHIENTLEFRRIE